MPRLEIDGPVLQALTAIRQNVAPLIAKRISHDSKGITSLAVLNSRDAFRFEIDQMFLYLRKEQDLPQKDYKQFLHDMHRLLQFLEELVDEEVLRPRTALGQDSSKQLDEVGTILFLQNSIFW